MPKKARLKRSDFAGISQKRARRVSGALFTLSVTPLPLGERAKAAVVVSKKVSPKASVRNLLRRRAREVLRPLIMNMHEPAALVFHARSLARDASFTKIRDDIASLVAQLR